MSKGNLFSRGNSNVIDIGSQMLHNMLVLGDFNLDTSNTALSTSIGNNGLYSIIKTATCFSPSTLQN